MPRSYFHPDLLTFVNKALPSDVAHFFRNPYIGKDQKLTETELIDLACTIKRPGFAPALIYAGVLPKFEDMGNTSPMVADEFAREGTHLGSLLGSDEAVQQLLAARRNGEKTPKQDEIVMANPTARKPQRRKGHPLANPEDIQIPKGIFDDLDADRFWMALGNFDRFAAVAVSKAGDTFKSRSLTGKQGGAMIGVKSIDGPDFAKEVADKLDLDAIIPSKKGYYIILPGKGAYEVDTKNGGAVQPVEIKAETMEKKRAEQMRLLVHNAVKNQDSKAINFLTEHAPRAAGYKYPYGDVRASLASTVHGPSWLLKCPDMIEKLASISESRQAWSANVMEAMNDWDPKYVKRFFQRPELYAHELNVEQRQFVATKLTNPDLAEVVVQAGTLPTPEQLTGAQSLVAQAFAVQRGVLLAKHGTPEQVEIVLAQRREAALDDSSVAAALPDIPNVPANIVDLSDRETARVASKR